MKTISEIMKEANIIADKECYCDLEDAESAPYPDCDNCEIHKASSMLNEIGEIVSQWERNT